MFDEYKFVIPGNFDYFIMILRKIQKEFKRK